MKRTLSTLFGLAVLCLFAEAQAVPATVSFTGRLTTSTGPVNGNVSVTFKLFDQATNGTEMWSEARPNLMANMGLVYADLGALTTLDDSILGNSPLFLEIQVGSEILTPRLALQSVPYSIRTETANTLGGTITAGDVVTAVMPAANGGLTLGRSGNTVTAGLLTTCAANQVLKAGAGGSWACAADANTTYTAFANGGINVSGTTIGLLTTCAAGQVLKAGAGGTWACANDTDTNTTYTALAGGGVSVVGTTIGLLTTCSSGQVLKAGATAGQWACATDNNTTYAGTAPITVSGTTISLAGDGVTATHIGPGAVTNSELGAGSVTMSKLSLVAGTAAAAQVMATSGVISPAAATITPEATGQCYVTSHLSTVESGATGNVDVQVARGTSIFGPEQAITTAAGTTRYSADVTAVVSVTGGVAAAFGCDVDISAGSSFLGNSFTCTVSFVCFS